MHATSQDQFEATGSGAIPPLEQVRDNLWALGLPIPGGSTGRFDRGGFPESSRLYWQRGPAAAIAMLEMRLGAMVARGELDIPHLSATAAQFAYALLGPLQDRAMFEVAFTPGGSEVDRFVDNAIRQLMLAFARS